VISTLFHHQLPRLYDLMASCGQLLACLARKSLARCALLLAATVFTPIQASASANTPARPLILIYGDSLSAEYGL
jgi:hypothetical protein